LLIKKTPIAPRKKKKTPKKFFIFFFSPRGVGGPKNLKPVKCAGKGVLIP